ncbi:unnamed protein product, partial [Amoebophrya sp. A120]
RPPGPKKARGRLRRSSRRPPTGSLSQGGPARKGRERSRPRFGMPVLWRLGSYRAAGGAECCPSAAAGARAALQAAANGRRSRPLSYN